MLLQAGDEGILFVAFHALKETDALRAGVLVSQLQTVNKLAKLIGIKRRTNSKYTGGRAQHLDVKARATTHVGR
jgi:hypothetical protein